MRTLQTLFLLLEHPSGVQDLGATRVHGVLFVGWGGPSCQPQLSKPTQSNTWTCQCAQVHKVSEVYILDDWAALSFANKHGPRIHDLVANKLLSHLLL